MTLEEIFELEIEPEKTEEEVSEIAHQATNFYNNYFKRVLLKMIFDQFNSVIEKKGNEEFIRGSLNALDLIDIWFKRQRGIVKDKNKEEE